MKKVFLLLVLFELGIFSVNAQTPEKKSRAVVFKFTETWCGPCGAWGWNLANNVIDSIGDNGYYVGVMGSSDVTLDANCWSPFQTNFILDGYPTFVVNDVKALPFFSSIKGKYEQFAATEPLASPAGFASISGNSISVTTKTKFWSAANGTYYLAAFLIEDKVKAEQLGQTGIVEHHFLMRGSMMPDFSPWGQVLASGAIAANTEFNKTFTMPLNPSWVKNNISVLLVVYKKVDEQYVLVNAVKAKNQPTGVDELNLETEMAVFPNPATNQINLQMKLAQVRELAVFVCDITGREIFKVASSKYKEGEHNLQIPVSNLANGLYSIRIDGNGARAYKRFVINK
jgi:hypothetical protein